MSTGIKVATRVIRGLAITYVAVAVTSLALVLFVEGGDE